MIVHCDFLRKVSLFFLGTGQPVPRSRVDDWLEAPSRPLSAVCTLLGTKVRFHDKLSSPSENVCKGKGAFATLRRGSGELGITRVSRP